MPDGAVAGTEADEDRGCPWTAQSRRADLGEVAVVLTRFDTRYWAFAARRFRENLVSEHDLARGRDWVRPSLRAHGRTWRAQPAPACPTGGRYVR